jgi:hypothetical protein
MSSELSQPSDHCLWPRMVRDPTYSTLATDDSASVEAFARGSTVAGSRRHRSNELLG